MSNRRPQTFDLSLRRCSRFPRRFSSRTNFLEGFRDTFSNILVYHASNLNQTEIEDIAMNGLRLSSPSLLKELALRRFISKIDPDQVQKDIESIIEDYCGELDYPNANEINFSMSRDELETDHYHYLLFGPETLQPLAQELTRRYGLPFKKRMIEHGYHCVIVALLSTSLVDPIWIENLFGERTESPLVYYKDVPARQIVKIDRVKRPVDKWNIGYF